MIRQIQLTSVPLDEKFTSSMSDKNKKKEEPKKTEKKSNKSKSKDDDDDDDEDDDYDGRKLTPHEQPSSMNLLETYGPATSPSKENLDKKK